MYLGYCPHHDGLHYILRETYEDDGCLRSRDLFDLGTHPERYIEYPGGNGFFYNSDLEESLQKHGVVYTSQELDHVLMPFLAPHIRRILEQFDPSSSFRSCHLKHSSIKDLHQKHKRLLPFDLRRLHFLRCGRVDIGQLDQPRLWRFASVLFDKSRDEIEHTFYRMEQSLPHREVRPYLYTAFELQAYFRKHLLAQHPEALDPEKVDDFFLTELCAMNRNTAFFSGVCGHSQSSLHSYLTRYAILYFDHSFDVSTGWTQYLRDYVRRSSNARQRHGGTHLTKDHALHVLGISKQESSTLTPKELLARYRHLAKEHHPDRGGDHDRFVELTEAYQCLLRTLP